MYGLLILVILILGRRGKSDRKRRKANADALIYKWNPRKFLADEFPAYLFLFYRIVMLELTNIVRCLISSLSINDTSNHDLNDMSRIVLSVQG